MSSYDPKDQDAAAKAGRWFDLTTPLGEDVLIVTEVRGEEGVSRLYQFEITVVSEKQTIAPGDLLGKDVTLKLGCLAGAEPARYLDGIVTRFRAGRKLRNGLREFRLTVSPSLWTWQRTSRYKVFQNMSAKDIVLQMLGDDSNIKIKNNLAGSYDPREYCIQYGESDFDFFARLIAEEGIFYTFTHKSGEHTLVLEDSATWSSGQAVDLAYNPGDLQSYDIVNAFETGPGLIDAKYTATDYDFENPGTPIKDSSKTAKAPSASQSWEHQVHGVRLPTAGSVKGAAATDIAGAEAGYETSLGGGTDPHLVPGFVFQLPEFKGGGTDDDDDGTDDDDDDDDANGAAGGSQGAGYVVTGVRHDGIEPAWGLQSRTEKRPPYRNTFECIPAKVPLPRFVPPQKPLARGPATALVVGPGGSEVHTDKYGRIKVQFFWDLLGSKDDTSSCFIRVAQPWAGKNWGAVFLPRVGMEVVVQFLDGDPDRPLVTGTVYNGTNMPPWTLPDNLNKSGILTRSSKSGAVANANELSFDDTKGSEVFLLHAEKDHKREVENDETITVGHDQISEVKNDRTVTVKEGNDTLSVEQGNRSHTIKQGGDTLEVTTGDRTQTIKTGNDTLEVSTGNRAVTVKTGNHDLKVSLGNASTLCDVGKIALQAAQSVKLTCGMNTLELTPQGIKLNGIQVTVQATAMLEEKAPMISMKADALAQIEGGIVQIN